MANDRIGGVVFRLMPTCGIIKGDDGIHYFFMPPNITPPHSFGHLTEGKSVTFSTYQHVKGLRAEHIAVVSPSLPDTVTHGISAN